MSRTMCQRAVIAALLLVGGAVAQSPEDGVFEQGQAAFNAAGWTRAIELLRKEVEANPGHEMAYVLLARAMEAAGDRDGAFQQWNALLSISRDEDVRQLARKGFIRTRTSVPKEWREQDPFHVPDIDINYKELEQVDSEEYVTSEGSEIGVPPILKETKHFTIYACSEKMAEVLDALCEKYLAHLLDRFLDGRAWALRVPILVYKNQQDYNSTGKNPEGSGGVTYSDQFGRPVRVALFQIADEDLMKFMQVDHPVKGNLEIVLPHELTHMVLNDYFGDQHGPRWLHEGCARQMEQLRKDLEEAADLARDAVSGEFIRFRDLFAAEVYPGPQTLRFYDQSCTIVNFLLMEYGPESFRVFLDELRANKGYDVAIGAALGVSEEGAVEELERRWVEWMRQRYAKDLKADEKEPATCVASNSRALRSPVLAKETAEKITQWADVPTQSLSDFLAVDGSTRHWKVEGGKLRCGLPESSPTPSVLGLKILEDPPLLLRCKVKSAAARSSGALFGFAQLNIKGNDLGVRGVFPLPDTNAHELLCFFDDYLTVYMDGQCVARSPTLRPPPDEVDIDFPLAFVAHAPVQVWDVRTATVKEFVLQSLQENKEGENPGDANRDPGRGN